MKAYKGFNRHDDGTLWCQDLQYEPGKTYKHEGKVKLCKSGFHACHELWQVLPYYPNNGKTVYYEVECGGEIIESDDDDGKFVCSEIRLVKEIDMTDVAKFDFACDFHEGFALVGLNGKMNFIDTEGKLLSEQWYDGEGHFSEGFAAVKLNSKWNHIDTSGKLLSERWYDDTWNFHEGFALVGLDDKWNFIDKEGKLISEQWYDDALDFSKGFAVVKLDSNWYGMDTEGKIVELN